MPANNTNTRSIVYIGDDPELRKFIHKWDSINYEFEENNNEKILYPKCVKNSTNAETRSTMTFNNTDSI